MPSAPQERRLYGQLLMALNAPYRPGDRLAAVEYTALMLLRKVAPRLIVVDEVHNVLAGTALEQRASLNLLKFLSNQLQCAIVVLGTRDALAAMQTDPPDRQPFSWLRARALAGERRLSQLPRGIRAPVAAQAGLASLGQSPHGSAIMGATAGVTGRISNLLSRAARQQPSAARRSASQ